MQDGAIGEHNAIQASCGIAGFGRVDVDGDNIAGAQGSLAPAYQPKRLGTGRFARPMYDRAFVILHVEFHEAVGIGPRKFRHRGLLEFSCFVRVRRASMMRQQWGANSEKTNAQNERHRQLVFHFAPLKTNFAVRANSLKGDPLESPL